MHNKQEVKYDCWPVKGKYLILCDVNIDRAVVLK